MESQKLFRLNDLSDYEIADNQPDIRGWKLIGSDGVRFGKVRDLLIEKEFEKVRYVDVELENEFRGEAHNSHILVPIGMVALREHENELFVDNLTRGTIRDWPAYGGDKIDRSYEDSIRTRLFAGQKDWTPVGSQSYYDYDYYDDTGFRGRRSKV